MSAQTGNRSGGRTAGNSRAALDPTNPSLTQPWKRLVDEGFITELCVRFTPTGQTTWGKPDARVSGVEGSGLQVGVDAPLGMIKAAADKGNLIPIRKNAKTANGSPSGTPLPAKSLIKSDLTGSDAELLGRARRVAQACGGQTLVGRVRSAGAFNGEVTTSFQDWWRTAAANDKVKSIVQPRHLSELTEADINRIANLECPFRGTADFVVASEEGEDEEPAQAPARSSPPRK